MANLFFFAFEHLHNPEILFISRLKSISQSINPDFQCICYNLHEYDYNIQTIF